ncbi:MAG TPA: class I SAM-dependent methyltransferase [Actinomycetota bacterium]|nr:class I SAM-dependent methyltransferase [Actinomycetota bacterium]
MSRELLEPEFGIYSSWLVEAIRHLPPADRIPAACRGTGRPALLEDLSNLLGLQEADRLLDIGSGLGGPAAWVMQRRRCRVICLDLMELEVGGSMQLFPELSGIVASATALPLSDASVDAAWALGVVEMVPERQQSIGEVSRVLKQGGRFGLYGFFATGADIPFHPAVNRFDRPESVLEMFEHKGLRVIHAAPASTEAVPTEWGTSAASARSAVRRRHAGEHALALAETQLGSFNWLRMTRQIRDWVMVGEKVTR